MQQKRSFQGKESFQVLVTMYVTSLYMNIPHEMELDAYREILNTRDVLDPPTNELVHPIDILLRKNKFFFDNLHYLQKHGTAMGTLMSPSYASIFMGKLEGDLLQ